MAKVSSLVDESPILLPLNKDKTIYDGFVTVQVTTLTKPWATLLVIKAMLL